MSYTYLMIHSDGWRFVCAPNIPDALGQWRKEMCGEFGDDDRDWEDEEASIFSLGPPSHVLRGLADALPESIRTRFDQALYAATEKYGDGEGSAT